MTEGLKAAMPRVWVTRTLPDARATADRVRSLGCEPIIAPLLQVQPLQPELDLNGVGALAFTSAHGLGGFVALHAERELPVFTVGDRTAELAVQAGFERVVSAGGDLGDLVALIARHRTEFAGVVLRPGAQRPAGDFVGALAGLGVPARSVAVYAATATPAAEVLAAFDGAWPVGLSVVLLHSPRAAEHLCDLFRGRPAPADTAVGISPRAVAHLSRAGFAQVVCAAAPSEAAMLSSLESVLGGTTPASLAAGTLA
jgi:uroporphyrinogen-III synthase